MLKTFRQTTIGSEWWPMFDLPTIKLDRCAVCGRTQPLEQHHVPPRSAGNMIDGEMRKKPTITLCGLGNVLYDADGVMFCHGAWHHRLLHFRNIDGCWHYLQCSEPTRYIDALDMEGWDPIDGNRPCRTVINSHKIDWDFIPF